MRRRLPAILNLAFHEVVAAASHNRYLPRISHRHHVDLVDAFRRGDSELAGRS